MYECYLGQIQAVGFGFAPKGWALCQGQQMAISQNQALFSLLGTTYGGNGVTTFALPDLRSRVPIGAGTVQGQPPFPQGAQGGVEQVTLMVAEIPTHVHAVQGTLKAGSAGGETNTPSGNYLAAGTLKEFVASPKNTTLQAGSVTGTLSASGSNQPHENRQPFIAMNYAIALQGIFPSPS